MYTQKILDILKYCFAHPLFNSSWPAVLSSTLTAIFLHKSSVNMEIRKRKLICKDFISIVSEELVDDIKIFKKIRDRFNSDNSALILYSKQLLEELLSNNSILINKDLRSYIDNGIVSRDILTYINLKNEFINGFRWDLDILFETYGVISNTQLSLISVELSKIPEDQKNPKEKSLSSFLGSRRESTTKIIESAEVILKHFKN